MAQHIDVLTPITNWVASNGVDIHGRANQPGGWENWAQVEIITWFDNHTPFISTLNPNCYANGGEADFVVTAGLDFQDAIIELKVWNQISETSGAFVARLLTDYVKIRTRAIAAGFVGDRFWSIGISNVAGRDAISTALAAANAGYQRDTFQGYDVWAYIIDR